MNTTGSILCVGADGHVEIDSFGHPCCEGCDAACLHEQDKAAEDHHSDCGDCTDLPLIQDTILNRPLSTISLNESPVDSPLAFPDRPESKDPSSVSRIRPMDFALTNKAPSFVSTTVLLC